MKEIAAGSGLLDILSAAIKLAQSRKFCIQEKEQFKFCHDVVLYHAQDLLIKRGILVSTPSFGTKTHTGTPSHVRHPSEDFMLRSNSNSSRSAVAPETPAVVPSTAPVDAPTEPAVPAAEPVVPTPQPEATEEQPMAVDEPAPEGPMEEGEEVSIDVTEYAKGKEQQQQPDSAVAVEATAKEGGVAAVADLLDPATFTLDPSQGTPAKQKITRESFMNPPGSLAQTKPDPKDPLSQLDPLWSLKKGKE